MNPKVSKKVKIISLSIIFLAILLTATFLIIGLLSTPPRKPVIHYGSDKCDYCGMVIVDRQYSAAYYYITEERWRKFDDIGCMFLQLLKDGEGKVSDIYVADYIKGELIDGYKAYYVHASIKEVPTPMSTGIVAFEDRSAAETFSHKHEGQIFTFHELLNWVKTHPDKVFQEKMEHEHMG